MWPRHPDLIRRPGGGRKKKTCKDPTLLKDLKALVEPTARGDPMRALLWTCRSLRNLVWELAKQGHKVCPTVVSNLLREMDYSLQANSKTRKGSEHIDRDALADELKIPITVCHFPPGTSKWNKIEHRLFSFITINWRGKPLRTYRTIVQLIAATTTEAGLKVRAELDENKYPKGVKVSNAQLAAVNLIRHTIHGDWNYTIAPRRRAN